METEASPSRDHRRARSDTPRRRANESRRALVAEARLNALVETATDAIVVIDEVGIVHSANRATAVLFGYSAEELIGRNINLLIPEPVRSAHDGYLEAYRRTCRRRIIGIGREVEGQRKDGSHVPIDLSVAEWRAEGRRYFTGLMRDISARKIAEAERLRAESRELVLNELRHRTRNMFAVINALVSGTARSHGTVEEFRRALLARIDAFAASQLELVQDLQPSESLRGLLEFELRPFHDSGRRISLDGDDLNLGGPAAENLALITHELATNAAKYGALSRSGTTLEVSWRIVSQSPKGATFRLDWIERGGPPVILPMHRGFGSTVIASAARALGGTAELEFNPGGLRCALALPANRILARADTYSR